MSQCSTGCAPLSHFIDHALGGQCHNDWLISVPHPYFHHEPTVGLVMGLPDHEATLYPSCNCLIEENQVILLMQKAPRLAISGCVAWLTCVWGAWVNSTSVWGSGAVLDQREVPKCQLAKTSDKKNANNVFPRSCGDLLLPMFGKGNFNSSQPQSHVSGRRDLLRYLKAMEPEAFPDGGKLRSVAGV